MKKFLCTVLIFILIWGTVYATNFSDIVGLECEDAVNLISELGIVNGTGNGRYEPNKSLTRAELSKMIVLSLKLKTNNSNVKNFFDVANHWGKEYILVATNNNILKGYEDGSFKPDGEVTYAEAIAIMLRSMGYTNLENNYENVWYESYLLKMNDVGLNFGVKEFIPESHANRGDIAIFLKNMILYLNNSSNSPKLEYWDNVQVDDIFGWNGHVWFKTSKGSFYMDENIDLGNLGSFVSGYYDRKEQKLYNAKFDDKVETIKKSGNAKEVSKEISYDVFSCKNLFGYGDPEYAEYVDVFVARDTNEVIRVVYFDTRENHFADKIKIGTDKITIESKDVYDVSIVLDKGNTYTYYILRNESVMDISLNSIAIYNGKVTSWDNIPSNVDIIHISGNNIYECNSKIIDGKIESVTRNLSNIQIEKRDYRVNGDCICRSTVADESAKLYEFLSYEDIMLISEKDGTIKFYLNKFDEIVKIEFEYDIWKYKADNERTDKKDKIKKYIDALQIIINKNTRIEQKEDILAVYIDAKALPDDRRKSYKIKDDDFEIGDLLYTISGEKKLSKITSKTQIGSGEVLTNYMYEIANNKMGMYYVDNNTEYIEVILKIDSENKDKYSDCTLKYVTIDELDSINNYKNIYVIVDEDGFIVRLYALKEIGSKYNYGIVKTIENLFSGDEYLTTCVQVRNANNSFNRYYTMYTMEYDEKDLISFTTKSKGDNDKYDTLILNEVYNHENLNSEKDMIVSKVKGNTIYFENSDFILNLDDEKYDNYIFIKADVERIDEGWGFKSFSVVNKKSNLFAKDYCVAISELTNTIVIYRKTK